MFLSNALSKVLLKERPHVPAFFFTPVGVIFVMPSISSHLTEIKRKYIRPHGRYWD